MSCPWQNFPPDHLYFCEREICGWVRQPANAWSMVPMLVVGVAIIFLTRVRKQEYLKLYGWILIVLAAGSFFYHATGALWGGIFDLAGMFLVANYLLVMVLWRLWGIKRKILLAVFVVGSVLLTTLHAFKPNLGTPFFVLVALAAFFLEIKVWIKEGKVRTKSYFILFTALVLTALVVWILDVTRVVCDPNNHLIQGHAIWHALSAVAFFVLYLYLSKVKLPEWKLI